MILVMGYDRGKFALHVIFAIGALLVAFQGATKLFSWLKDCEPDRVGEVNRHLLYDSNKAEKHAKFCFDNIERAAQHLNHEKMKADQQQEVRERHQRALEKVRHDFFNSAALSE